MSEDLTMPQAAKYMQVSPQAVYIAIRSGKMKAYQKGRRWYISMEAIHEYIGKKYNRKYSVNSKGKPSFDKDKGELCTREVAERLNIPMQRAYYLIRTGILRSRRKGGSYVMFIKDLEEAKKILNNNAQSAAQVESYGDSINDNGQSNSLGGT